MYNNIVEFICVDTSRQTAHVACLESPQAVCDWLLDRLTRFAGDPAAALDFEIVDLVRS